jgi:hypothetical protein
MNVNVWDVTDQIQQLVRAGHAVQAVDLDRLADPAVPVDRLAQVSGDRAGVRGAQA